MTDKEYNPAKMAELDTQIDALQKLRGSDCWLQSTVTALSTAINALVEQRNLYTDIPNAEKPFVTVDGQVYHNLKELQVGLLTMNQGVFNEHVSDQRNDFAVWIFNNKQLTGNYELALELLKVHSRALTAYKVGMEWKKSSEYRNKMKVYPREVQ